jgi:hypothetical protein
MCSKRSCRKIFPWGWNPSKILHFSSNPKRGLWRRRNLTGTGRILRQVCCCLSCFPVPTVAAVLQGCEYAVWRRTHVAGAAARERTGCCWSSSSCWSSAAVTSKTSGQSLIKILHPISFNFVSWRLARR